MKIFAENPPMTPAQNVRPRGEPGAEPRVPKAAKGSRKGAGPGVRQLLPKSPEEIREKVAANMEKVEVQKSQMKKAAPLAPHPETSLGLEEKAGPAGEGGVMQSPEKLRKILQSGAFQFSTQERGNLERILSQE